jgi:hemerythrin-like domain-containing protein
VARKCITQLKADHQKILQGLEVLREMVEQLETNDSIARQDVFDLLEFFRCFAHEYHDAKEQFLLLPAIAGRAFSADTRTFDTIASDHCHIYTAIEKLRRALIQQNDTKFVELAAAYIELLTTHIFNEECFLFEAMERMLTEARDEQLYKAFEAFEPQLREYSALMFNRVVDALRRKYYVAQCV